MTERLHFHFHALEKEMATHPSILAWKIHGQRSLEGYSPWGPKESDMTYQLNNTTNKGPNIRAAKWKRRGQKMKSQAQCEWLELRKWAIGRRIKVGETFCLIGKEQLLYKRKLQLKSQEKSQSSITEPKKNPTKNAKSKKSCPIYKCIFAVNYFILIACLYA